MKKLIIIDSAYTLKLIIDRKLQKFITSRDNNNYFDHVHCSGVIHHTEFPDKCYEEIHRILNTNGSAVIGVYYMNFILRNWKWIKFIVRSLKFLQPNLKGRKRDQIFLLNDYKDVVRYFDGEDNPKGIAYTKKEMTVLVL